MKALIRIKVQNQIFRLKETDFESKEDILTYIWDTGWANRTLLPFDEVVINLRENSNDIYRAYLHNSLLEHYCYGKGRITESEFAAMQFTDDYLMK